MLPASVAAISFVAPYLIPACEPQLYGVGVCMLGSVNDAVAIVLGIFGGIYIAAVLGIFVSGPLYALAWWLDLQRKPRGA